MVEPQLPPEDMGAPLRRGSTLAQHVAEGSAWGEGQGRKVYGALSTPHPPEWVWLGHNTSFELLWGQSRGKTWVSASSSHPYSPACPQRWRLSSWAPYPRNQF